MLEWVWTPQFPKTHPQTFAFPEVSLYKEVTGKHAQFCWEQTTQWASGPQLALLTHTLAWELIMEFLLMALKSCTSLPKCEGEVPSLEGDTAPGSSSSHVERPADGANSQPRNLLGYLWISGLDRCVKGRRFPTGVDLMALIISRPFNTSTLIMVDFPGHKFHGHTCYLQDNYWSFNCKVSTMERMRKSHGKQL